MVYWTSGDRISPLPLSRTDFSAKPGLSHRVVVLGLARCRCRIVDSWNLGKISLPNGDIPTAFWLTSDFDDDDFFKLDGEDLTYTEKMRKKLYPETAAKEAKRVADVSVRTVLFPTQIEITNYFNEIHSDFLLRCKIVYIILLWIFISGRNSETQTVIGCERCFGHYSSFKGEEVEIS